MQEVKTIDQLPLTGKRVLVRVDYNIPRDSNGCVSDDRRIRETLPTLFYLLKKQASIILISHLADPKSVSKQYSLQHVVPTLGALLGKEVRFFDSCTSDEVASACAKIQPGEVFLLENLRFHPEEKANESSFAEKFAHYADFFIMDAFASSHRNHASIVGLPPLFRGRCGAGFLMEREMRFLSQHLMQPKRPFIAVIGGSKVSSKIGIVEKLFDKCDHLAIVGAMAFTFLKAKGKEVGRSLYEPDYLQASLNLLEKAEAKGKTILLPSDLLISDCLDRAKGLRTLDVGASFDKNSYGVDIGEKTIGAIYKLLQPAKTLFWNGPAGIFEVPEFSFGTKAIANIFASHPHTTAVGGGDSCAALKMCQVEDKIDHISTGGGACLEMIEKETLPGIEALKKYGSDLDG